MKRIEKILWILNVIFFKTEDTLKDTKNLFKISKRYFKGYFERTLQKYTLQAYIKKIFKKDTLKKYYKIYFKKIL